MKRTKVIIAMVATGFIAASCGPANIAKAEHNPVRTYQVPRGTVVCILEKDFINSTATALAISCDWDHATPNKGIQD